MSRRVRPGDPLKITAAEYNRLLAAAEAYERTKLSTASAAKIYHHNAATVRVHNTHSTAVQIGEIVGFETPLGDPTADAASLARFVRDATIHCIQPNTITARAFAKSWIRGVVIQASLFLSTSLLIMGMGRTFGLIGAALAVLGVAVGLVAFQLRIAKLAGALTERVGVEPDDEAVISEALQQASDWGWNPRPIIVLDHDDTGFTGGVVGLPGRESIIVPAASLTKLTAEQLAVTIARRLEAIQSGSRTRGMLLAFAWVIVGFVLSAMLPGAGVTSVGELTMTCLGFTLWTFLGLLTLPTLSRQAAHAIDRKVLDQGASAETFYATVKTLDRLQDDEPQRSAWIETIFHPVPSVDNRRSQSESTFPIAWHAARMTLFVPWACMGMLVRAVHCNVGRPELWVMPPTD